jgi:glycosyltransferase involved in cell wall biosynthesis
MSHAGEILFFLCLQDRGGAEISMIKLAQGLVISGRRVTLAVYGSMPSLAREYGFEGEVIDLGDIRTFKTVIPLYKILSTRRFSSLISALTHTNIAAVIAGRLSVNSLKVIVTEHGIDGLMACERSIFFSLITGWAYLWATCVVTVSKALEESWRQILPKRAVLVTIYNPVVDDKAFEIKPAAHAWLADKQIPVIIGIGRLKEEKNFSLLIRAFAKLVVKKEARLIILGEGVERPLLEKLIDSLGLRDKVCLPGFVANIQPWLSHASVLVCPSQREGFGNVVVEALALGIPVVATQCPGPAEILEDGRYGCLVQLNKSDEMAQAIEEMLGLDIDREFLRQRGADFTVARCIDAYLSLVDNP